MSAATSPEPMESIIRLLADLTRKGTRLWTENGALRYRAPRGALTAEEKERLAAASAQVAALLDQSIVHPPPLQPRALGDLVPLTVPQLVHWRTSRLGEQPTRRSVTSANRLRGPLNLDLLRESVEAVVRRHEGLRTRIRSVDGIPMQEVAEHAEYQFEVVDLTRTPEQSLSAEVERQIQDLILQPIHVAIGPMFGVRVLRLGATEHVLIAAMEHSISDAVSGDILLRDLFTIYKQTALGRAPQLPELPVHFADHAVWLSKLKTHPGLLERHRAYWGERLREPRRLRFPSDGHQDATAGSPWRKVPLLIDAGLKAELQEFCRRRQTTPVLAVFSAFVALALRWCGVREGVVAFQIDGRTSALLANTIGYFADVLYLRVQLHEADTFIDMLESVTEEYCTAQEHALLNAIDEQFVHPELVRGTGFNWIPQQLKDSLVADDAADLLSITPLPFTYPMPVDFDSDHEPGVVMVEQGDTISGSVAFPLNRFSLVLMESFASCVLFFITELIRNPQQCIGQIELPALKDLSTDHPVSTAP